MLTRREMFQQAVTAASIAVAPRNPLSPIIVTPFEALRFEYLRGVAGLFAAVAEKDFSPWEPGQPERLRLASAMVAAQDCDASDPREVMIAEAFRRLWAELTSPHAALHYEIPDWDELTGEAGPEGEGV